MKSIFKTNINLLLLSLLLVSTPLLLSQPTAKASNAAVLYAPNYWSDAADYGNELEYTSQCVNTIMNLFTTYGTNYGWRYNCQNSAATASAYVSNTQYAETNFNNVAVFSKGHEVPFGGDYHPPTGGDHYKILAYNAQPVRDSYEIYPYTQGKAHFVWIWHCGSAMSYPPWLDGDGYTGMPYAWTRDSTMALSGYSSNSGTRVYIGFANYSHQFLDPTGYAGHDYGYFVVRVFTYLLQYHYSMSTSLDRASQDAFNQPSYTGTPLYYGQYIGNPSLLSFMVVYGNGQGLGVPN
jgi:hypothetical protein